MTVKNHSNDALIVSLVTSSLDGTALPGEQHLAGSLLDRWREGEFETTADETAQAALDDQAVGLDVAPIIEAWLTAITPAPQTHTPASIVPPHCAGYSFVFEPGVLHVKKDGSGYIVVNEDDFVLEDDRCEGPDGPEGSIHWIARMDASEIIALRDFLNGNTTADRLADKIEDLIAEFGDDPKAALECVSEHLQLRRHARSVSRDVIEAVAEASDVTNHGSKSDLHPEYVTPAGEA